MNNTFNKMILTKELLWSDIMYLTKKLPAIISMLRSKRISRAFAEKIILATTAVNQCLLCARFHSEMAYQSGIDRSEVLSLLNMDLKGRVSSDYELTALLYAQHYAETRRKPKPDMTERLYNDYGRETADDIILIIRLIIFANLSGNTFSAFTSRIMGAGAPGSNLLFELFFAAISAPLIIPSLLYLKIKKNKFEFDRP